MQSCDTEAALRRVEAARYVLVRRLAPAMRHRMLAHLEPVTTMAGVLERRLHQSTPDLARIEADVAKVHGFARDAVGVNLDIVTWLAPEEDVRVTLDAGAQESVALLRGHLGFLGFSLRHLPSRGTHEVARACVRTLLPAVLFALADAAGGPARLTVAAEADAPVLAIQAEEDPAAFVPGASPPYRLLRWDAVEALARAEGVALAHGGSAASLRFPG
jgi:hypothetical protein